MGSEAEGGRAPATLAGLAVTGGALGMTLRCRSSNTGNNGGLHQQKKKWPEKVKHTVYCSLRTMYLVQVLQSCDAQQEKIQAPNRKEKTRRVSEESD